MGRRGTLFIEFINAGLGTRAMPVARGAREREGERMSGYDAAICVNAMPRAESKAATVESTCWHTHILYSTL